MKITEMIMDWRKGCSCCDGKPIQCNECTLALIKAIDEKAFVDEVKSSSDAFVEKHGAFGIPMAASYCAVAVQQRQITIRAINEQANKKD